MLQCEGMDEAQRRSATKLDNGPSFDTAAACGEAETWLTLGCAAASVVARLARYRGGSKAGAPAECTSISQLTKEPTGLAVSAARTRTPK